jgi:exo-beta-1,3-glucanase (GH17 family)
VGSSSNSPKVLPSGSLKSAYVIVKTYSDIPVVFTGISPRGDWQDYLNSFFAYGDVEDYFDFMDIHFYFDDMDTNLDVLHFVKGLTDKPIWVTETGKPSATENYSESKQAEYLSSVYSTFNSLVDKIFVYELKDNQGLFPLKENYFGLLTIDGKQKQAYQVICDINAKVLKFKLLLFA